ncbi:MAG: hypothetical protein PHC43_09455 [Candidatus Marinimicrobia bacterium]|nr:hypothetical protein [Candidatus Neomarinimicrobiota bacterium]
MDYQLQQQLKQTVYMSSMDYPDPQTGEDRYNLPTAILARVVGKIRKITNKNGLETVSNQQIVLVGPVAIDASDIFWLPGEDHLNWSIAHHPQAISNNVDEFGNHDWSEVFL